MDKKSKRVLFLIYIIAFFITCLGTAMAFFLVEDSTKVVGESDITSATTTSLIFNAGDPLSISASLMNFNSDIKNNLSDETFTSVTLKKGTDVDVAKYHYNIDLVLNDNSIIYSTTNKTPELLLTVTDPSGKELQQSTDDLKYVTVTGNNNKPISGFDITNKNGKFSIVSNYLITSDNFDAITDTWHFTLTFVNLDLDQTDNTGKSLSGHIEIKPVDTEGGSNV